MTLRRSISFLAAVAALLSTFGPASRAATKGTFAKHTYRAGGSSRDYWLYLPATKSKKPRPLVVFLHGCIQDAKGAAASTRFNQLADKRNFVVVYPQQNVTGMSTAPVVDGNGVGCWNWFLPDDQVRDKGEPALIAGITRSVMKTRGIDRNRVFIEGISAGADMAVTLAANYPDLYTAAAVIAGCAYMLCADVTGALAYRAMGPRARVVPMFVEQGTADTLNPLPQAVGLVNGWLGTGDMADDGMMNASVSRSPASIAHFGLNQTPKPGSGDPCVRNNNYPCLGGVAGFQGTYPYTVGRYADAKGCDVLDFWVIHGMEHAYPNADPATVYSDPLGPDVTTAAFNFFASHPRGACAKI